MGMRSTWSESFALRLLRCLLVCFAFCAASAYDARLGCFSEVDLAMPKVGEQIAALPMRVKDDGTLEILMVTSRGTGRWVMPKGWEMDGKKPWRAAEIEALEEAGAVGFIGHEVIGTYRYTKIRDDGKVMPCKVRVYPMVVEKLKRRWKERDQRVRRWFSPKAAAKRVVEEDLAKLLLSLHKKPHKKPEIRSLMKRAQA